MNIKKGDQVKIVAGKDKGKSGTILRVFLAENRVAIEGINTYKKRTRPKQQGQKGETVSVVRPLNASNVMLVCPNCKAAVRVGHRVEGEKKVRYCKKCESSF